MATLGKGKVFLALGLKNHFLAPPAHNTCSSGTWPTSGVEAFVDSCVQSTVLFLTSEPSGPSGILSKI